MGWRSSGSTRDRPVLTHAAWAVVWSVPGMWNAQRIDVVDGIGTIPWPVGAAVMVALTVGMNALAVRLGHRAGHRGYRLLALAWFIPPATLLLPVLLPLLD